MTNQFDINVEKITEKRENIMKEIKSNEMNMNK